VRRSGLALFSWKMDSLRQAIWQIAKLAISYIQRRLFVPLEAVRCLAQMAPAA
jgi:hypothetical protein